MLTAGEQSFTSDPRFQVSVKASENDWVLIIRYVVSTRKRGITVFRRRTEKSDTGCYLCEVNTEPSSHIYPVYLNVIGKDSLNTSS